MVRIKEGRSKPFACDAMSDRIPDNLANFIRQHLTEEEENHISKQLSQSLVRNRQVLWTGMTRAFAQKWADDHDFQTLTTAMGPLMDESDPACCKRDKSIQGWTKYIHGASAIFAWRISQGELAVVLSRPPPQRFHPSGGTSFQILEEPIITGKLGNHAVEKIQIVHPAVPAAANFSYQLRPHDAVSAWIEMFGEVQLTERWRKVKLAKRPLQLGTCGVQLAAPMGASCSTWTMVESTNPLEKQRNETSALANVVAGDSISLNYKHHKERALYDERAAQARTRLQEKQKAERESLQNEFSCAGVTLKRTKIKGGQQKPDQERKLMRRLKEKQKSERVRLHNTEMKERKAIHKRQRSEQTKMTMQEIARRKLQRTLAAAERARPESTGCEAAQSAGYKAADQTIEHQDGDHRMLQVGQTTGTDRSDIATVHADEHPTAGMNTTMERFDSEDRSGKHAVSIESLDETETFAISRVLRSIFSKLVMCANQVLTLLSWLRDKLGNITSI